VRGLCLGGAARAGNENQLCEPGPTSPRYSCSCCVSLHWPWPAPKAFYISGIGSTSHKCREAFSHNEHPHGTLGGLRPPNPIPPGGRPVCEPDPEPAPGGLSPQSLPGSRFWISWLRKGRPTSCDSLVPSKGVSPAPIILGRNLEGGQPCSHNPGQVRK